MWRVAIRRLALIVGLVLGVTPAIAVSIGALAHDSLTRSIAVGYYVAGSLSLLGCLAFGLRGPMRRGHDDQAPTLERPSLLFGIPRQVRRTTPEERFEARRTSVLFFVFGIVLIVIGTAIDPTRSLV